MFSIIKSSYNNPKKTFASILKVNSNYLFRLPQKVLPGNHNTVYDIRTEQSTPGADGNQSRRSLTEAVTYHVRDTLFRASTGGIYGYNKHERGLVRQ
jgi:hypothetical protein